MLWTIAVILLVLWALGLVTSYTVPGGSHSRSPRGHRDRGGADQCHSGTKGIVTASGGFSAAGSRREGDEMSGNKILAIVLIVAGLLEAPYASSATPRKPTKPSWARSRCRSRKSRRSTSPPGRAWRRSQPARGCFYYGRRVKEERMKRILLAVPLGVFLFVGCMGPDPGLRRGRGTGLPSISWCWKRSLTTTRAAITTTTRTTAGSTRNARSWAWVELPRDRYPKEVRFKGRGDDRGRGGEARTRRRRQALKSTGTSIGIFGTPDKGGDSPPLDLTKNERRERHG